VRLINYSLATLATTEEQRIQHLSVLWCSAFIFHTILDPVTTYIVVVIFDAGTELNPLIKPWLQDGLRSFFLIHLPLYVLGICGLMILRWLFMQANDFEQLQAYYLSVFVLSGISVWGLLLVLNNLWVVWAWL